ncbi:MAG: hypothetical protein ACI4LO_01850 [Anaerovoracaceae bacterium]
MKNLKINRTHKDRLFRKIFSDKKSLLDLYNALNGTSYTDENDLTINDLEDAIYMGMKNDKSFIMQRITMNFYEHQSSWCPNMPIRGFFYGAEAYRAYVETQGLNLYGRTKIKLPAPRYVVFYNGDEETPDVMKLRLSDMFEPIGDEENEFEWTATLVNINVGRNKELMESCKALKDYSILIGKIKEYRKNLKIEDAIDKAVEECIIEDVLKDFLLKNRSEVMNTLLTEYNEKETMDYLYKEAREQGQDSINKLNELLAKANRVEDIIKAATDKEYQKELMKEFNLEQ